MVWKRPYHILPCIECRSQEIRSIEKSGGYCHEGTEGRQENTFPSSLPPRQHDTDNGSHGYPSFQAEGMQLIGTDTGYRQDEKREDSGGNS